MTVDALLALVVTVMLIMWSIELISSREFQKDDLLVGYGHDLLAIADKSGSLDRVILLRNTSMLKSIFENMTPYSLCIELEIYDQNGTFFYHADNYNDTELSRILGEDVQTGCLRTGFTGDTKPTAFVKLSRIWVKEGRIYPIKLELWYRGWKRE